LSEQRGDRIGRELWHRPGLSLRERCRAPPDKSSRTGWSADTSLIYWFDA